MKHKKMRAQKLISVKHAARCLVSLVLILAMPLMTACDNNLLKGARPIDDIHNLDGRRVGVTLSYGPDYLLTNRDDMTLVRYDSVSGMVMALSYGRIDAIALEKPYIPQVLASVDGLRMIEEPIAVDGVCVLVSTKRPDVLEKFNAFLAEFKKTAEYEDLVARVNDMSGFVPKTVEPTGTGEVLKVGIAEDGYPFTYVNFETGGYEGCDVELMLHFANACGYTLEFVPGSWSSMENGVCFGSLDIGVSACSNLYRDDYEMAGTALVSDVYMPMEFMFIEVEDRDALKINSTIDY